MNTQNPDDLNAVNWWEEPKTTLESDQSSIKEWVKDSLSSDDFIIVKWVVTLDVNTSADRLSQAIEFATKNKVALNLTDIPQILKDTITNVWDIMDKWQVISYANLVSAWIMYMRNRQSIAMPKFKEWVLMLYETTTPEVLTIALDLAQKTGITLDLTKLPQSLKDTLIIVWNIKDVWENVSYPNLKISWDMLMRKAVSANLVSLQSARYLDIRSVIVADLPVLQTVWHINMRSATSGKLPVLKNAWNILMNSMIDVELPALEIVWDINMESARSVYAPILRISWNMDMELPISVYLPMLEVSWYIDMRLASIVDLSALRSATKIMSVSYETWNLSDFANRVIVK